MIAGPFATTLLADMGAEVIKIELPGRGDDARYGYPAVDGVPVVFLALNRNKKGITLDMRKPQGAELFRAAGARRPTSSWRTSLPAPWTNGALGYVRSRTRTRG